MINENTAAEAARAGKRKPRGTLSERSAARAIGGRDSETLLVTTTVASGSHKDHAEWIALHDAAVRMASSASEERTVVTVLDDGSMVVHFDGVEISTCMPFGDEIEEFDVAQMIEQMVEHSHMCVDVDPERYAPRVAMGTNLSAVRVRPVESPDDGDFS